MHDKLVWQTLNAGPPDLASCPDPAPLDVQILRKMQIHIKRTPYYELARLCWLTCSISFFESCFQLHQMSLKILHHLDEARQGNKKKISLWVSLTYHSVNTVQNCFVARLSNFQVGSSSTCKYQNGKSQITHCNETALSIHCLSTHNTSEPPPESWLHC